MTSAAYNLGYALAKRAATLTTGAGERLMGGKKEPGLAQHAAERVRKSILPEGKPAIKPRPPSPPKVPAAGVAAGILA